MEIEPNPGGHFLKDIVGIVAVAAESAKHRQHGCTMTIDELQEDLPFRVQSKTGLIRSNGVHLCHERC
jgi:hypothetical protein